MAVRFSAISNNWNDATWQTVDSTSYLKSEAASTATTTSYVASQAFTPGIITVEGILLRIKGTTTTPTGTLSVQLWNSTGSAQVAVVTCNATDITNNNTTYDGGWCYFKFGSPVTLLGATNYQVRVLSSVAGTVTVYRDATAGNWSRGLVTSTTASLSASDDVIICGNITGQGTTTVNTVTFNYTGSDSYGTVEVSQYGKIICQNSASTNYKLTINNGGYLRISHNGIFEIGNSTTRIDASSTFLITLTNATNSNTFIDVRNYGTFRMFGATKTRNCLLAANAAVSATSLTTNISTGWKNGDELGIAGTGGNQQQQQRTLSADASGTTLTIGSGLTYATEGASPVQADVINLTSNVKIYGSSSSLLGYTLAETCSTYDIDQVEYKYMGASATYPAIYGKTNGVWGIQTAGYFSCKNCTFWGHSSHSINFGQLFAGVTIDGVYSYLSSGDFHIKFYNNMAAIYGSASSSVKNCILIGGGYGINSNNQGTMLFDTITCANNNTTGVRLLGYGSFSSVLTITNVKAYRCTYGISNTLAAPGYRLDCLAISNVTCFRCTHGMYLYGACNFTLDNISLFSNITSNLQLHGCSNLKFTNCSLQGGTTVVSPYGVYLNEYNYTGAVVVFENSVFGTVTGHSSGDISNNCYYTYILFNNCSFGSSNLAPGQKNMVEPSKMMFQRFNGVAGSHKTLKGAGTIQRDTTIYDGSPSSVRMTPNGAVPPTNTLVKLIGTIIPIAVPNGSVATISIKVRKSVAGDGTAYTGAQPRLILKANPSAGSAYNSDIVAATATNAANGAWETLSYTMPTNVTDNVGMEFYVDCDGNTGWINVDTFVSSNNNSMSYYMNGEPISDVVSNEKSFTFVG